MKTLHELLTEAEKKSDAQELAKAIEESGKKYFPDSFVQFKFSNNILPSIVGRFTLRKEYPNNIIQNDPAFHVFHIYGFDNEGNIKGELSTESNVGSLMIPSTNKMYAYDRVKTGFRKKKGNKEAIIKHYESFWKKLKTIIDENEKNIK